MRTMLLALVTVAACGKNLGTTNPDGNSGADAPGGTPAFTITSKDVTLNPGDQVTYCYYFHTPNTSAIAVNKWVTDMSPGSHHAILFFNATNSQPDGTIDSNNCGGVGGSATNLPIWVYSTQLQHSEEDIPADDGTGKPLAQKVPPNQAAYLQLHYLNASDAPLTAHIVISAYALPATTAFTQTDAYVTYNGSIMIPAGATGYVESMTCQVPPGLKFWSMSSHTHKQGVYVDVKDGSTVVYESGDRLNNGTNWEHPAINKWAAPSFYTFASNQMTYECTYDNTTGTNAGMTIVSGPSAVTNEMCMSPGYFFPSTGPHICYNNFLVQ